jgi:hypothetical protein
MQLTLEAFHAFSQGDDIRADIKGGWCAGMTAQIGLAIPHKLEGGYTTNEAWLDAAFDSAKTRLERLAAELGDSQALGQTHTLQNLLAKANDLPDVCGQIHQPAFNGRQCRVAMSVADWWPAVSGPVNYMLALGDYVFSTKWSKWRANHVGLLARGGNKLLLFDPNYGLGRFRIGDTLPLTLADITKAIATLAWKQSYSAYLGSCTVAIAVFDEDGAGLGVSVAQEEKLQELMDGVRAFRIK